jgi:hypothetical protein
MMLLLVLGLTFLLFTDLLVLKVKQVQLAQLVKQVPLDRRVLRGLQVQMATLVPMVQQGQRAQLAHKVNLVFKETQDRRVKLAQ